MKNTILISLILIIGIVGLLLTINPTQGQQTTKQDPDDQPTIVKKGQVTDKEREYSKQYKKKYANRHGKKLSEINHPDGIGIYIGPGSVAHSTSEPTITANQFLEKLSCLADVVVNGTVKNKASHLSDDETFVYTEYDFEVKKIVKNNSKSPIVNNQNISVARPGGFIKIDQQLIKFDDGSYEPLKLNKEYLLFLKFVPTTNGYIVASPQGDFALEDNNFRSLSKRGFLNGLKKTTNLETLLNMVQNAVSANCNQSIIITGE